MAKHTNSLEKLLIDGLKDLYDAEHQILETLPKMAKLANSDDLKSALQTHEQQTRQQAQRLEQVFHTMGETPSRMKCVGMEGIIKEGDKHMKEYQNDKDVLDAAMIAAAQKVEHYEICGYGTAKSYAITLGHQEAARLLDQTLQEECSTDERLTTLAENYINLRAQM